MLLEKKIDGAIELLLLEEQTEYYISLLNILHSMKHTLLTGIPTKNKREGLSYSLFRLITENYKLEQSKVGQQLLDLLNEYSNTSSLRLLLERVITLRYR